MRLVDSSAWIEFLSGSELGELVRRQFPATDEWLVPTIVQFELAKWYWRERRSEKIEDIVAFATFCYVVDLDTEISTIAAELWSKHKLAVADAIIYATALVYEADLVTCDKHFEGLARVIYVAKSGLH